MILKGSSCFHIRSCSLLFLNSFHHPLHQLHYMEFKEKNLLFYTQWNCAQYCFWNICIGHHFPEKSGGGELGHPDEPQPTRRHHFSLSFWERKDEGRVGSLHGTSLGEGQTKRSLTLQARTITHCKLDFIYLWVHLETSHSGSRSRHFLGEQ